MRAQLKHLVVTWVVLVVPLIEPGCSNRGKALQALASAGQIEERAPIKADASVHIQNSASTVWRLLVDVDD